MNTTDVFWCPVCRMAVAFYWTSAGYKCCRCGHVNSIKKEKKGKR